MGELICDDFIKQQTTIIASNMCFCIKQKHINLVIIRGMPGSGKTVLANQLHLLLDIQYHIQSEIIEDSQSYCQHIIRQCLSEDKIVILVNNRNPKPSSLRPYIPRNIDMNTVKFIEPCTPWKYNSKKCLIYTHRKDVTHDDMVIYYADLKKYPTYAMKNI